MYACEFERCVLAREICERGRETLARGRETFDREVFRLERLLIE